MYVECGIDGLKGRTRGRVSSGSTSSRHTRERMRLLPSRTPPLPPVDLPWRSLWRSNAFAQHESTWDSQLASRAAERGLRFGIGAGPLEGLDRAGALQPIAFADGRAPAQCTDLTPYEPSITFREEQPSRPWADYAWDARGSPHTSTMYSPWQLLYADDVLDRAAEPVNLAWLAPSTKAEGSALEQLTPIAEQLRAEWGNLDAAWRPLMKLLVRIQNRYLPVVTGRTTLLIDSTTHERVDPWPMERDAFQADAVLAELGLSVEDVLAAYWFLVERGVDREPQDGLEVLRRARPRSSHTRWRGTTRRAQDNYDAAAMVRLFLADLTGALPGRIPDWPIDGRQSFRESLYEHGPVPRLDRTRLKRALVETALYPHAVHVVGEGASEKAMVSTLVAGFLGEAVADELGFTDLGGSGAASRLATMVGEFTNYARRTVVIVDTEGDMAEYVRGLQRSGTVPPEDILSFDANLEDSNFAPEELVEVLAQLAAEGQPGGPEVTLNITPAAFDVAYERACSRTHETPGRAGVLLKLALAPAVGGPFVVSKPRFAEALAETMLDEWAAAGSSAEQETLLERRPLLGFVLSRVLPVMGAPR